MCMYLLLEHLRLQLGMCTVQLTKEGEGNVSGIH